MEAVLDYEPDAVVVDPEEDDMQIHGDDSLWHRPISLPDGEYFACGQRLDFRLRQATRNNAFDGPLCPLCFSPFEIGISAEHEREIDRTRRASQQALGSHPIPTIKIPPKKEKK